MPEYLTPGVYFEARDNAPPVIRRVRTDIAGFVGLAERGPLDQAVAIESWRQFQAIFGDLAPYGFLAYAVKGFFENGGRTCFIVRVAGETAAKAGLVLANSAGLPVIRVDAANEGTWGNRVAVTLALVRPSALTFSLVVTYDGRDRESFPDLSILPDDKRYFVRIISEGDDRTARSQWIRPTDLLPPEQERTGAQLVNEVASGLVGRTGFLRGGQDGIASLTKEDILGTADVFETSRKGLSVLDRVDAVGIVCVPDIQIRPLTAAEPPARPEPPRDPCLPAAGPIAVAASPSRLGFETPPRFTAADVFTMQRAVVEHCEQHRDRVAILDAPVEPTNGRPLTLAEVLDWRSRFDSERGFGAFYYPWIRVVDLPRPVQSPLRSIPPCGHVAGLYARTDFTGGVHQAPANGELFWAEDLTVDLDDDEQAVLNPVGVNCLRAFPGRGLRVYGARTISSNPDWRYVNVRRLLMMIEEAVDESTQWAVFEPHDLRLRQSLVVSVSGFLDTVWRQGGLVGATATEAYFVRCDETNNPPDVVDQGRLIVDVGVAPTRPAEFIVFRVGRTLEELEIVER